MQLYDMHTHSQHSFDSEARIMDVAAAAVDAKLAGVAITDHVDFGAYLVDDWREELRGSLTGASDAALRFEGRLDVLRGVEIGQPLQDEQLARETVTGGDFDVVVMALHNLEAWKDFYWLDYTSLDVDALLRDYFGELYRMVCWGHFDVLAHIGYPLRYIRRDLGVDWNLAPYADQIDAIYKQLIETGKALEVNTAAHNRGTGHITPDLRGLRRYRELGGELVTLGSDAHRVQFVGGSFAEGAELLRSAGFGYVAHYRGRTPILTAL